ncbi:unnamed protein product [Vicia faba]|uniref:Uncharacterized protein n=1 Tax=Vicia faba TaxID=3906 RepID=A0AAV0YDC6_VICFA|nr:unnamed protein product [Vicia faba]
MASLHVSSVLSSSETIIKSSFHVPKLPKIISIAPKNKAKIEMHQNIAQQRDNWNTLLLNSINMITLTASAMGRYRSHKRLRRLPFSPQTIFRTLFSASTGMLVIMNKIQPSQLAEEQRNATRLFKQLKSHIETTIALGNPDRQVYKDTINKVLALDRAYPLPLLGVMIEKFPQKYEPANWWPCKKLT